MLGSAEDLSARSMLLPKAEKAAWKVSVLVSTVAPRAASATAPEGSG